LAEEMINVQRREWMQVHLKTSEASDIHVPLESCLDKQEGVFVPSSNLQKISLETENDLTSPETTFFFPKDFFSSLRVIGQFNKGFIICSLLCCNEAKCTTLEIFVVDQHATDEKHK
jgi:DNA mismatch repair ATPase MutL